MRKADFYNKFFCYIIGAAIIFSSAILFFYIGFHTGDGDYITHYGNFYDEVIRNHGIQPNGWWYQYFYSKGAGLLFFSMLLTDKMAPPIVSYLFIMATGLMVFSLIKRISRDQIWPLIALFGYICAVAASGNTLAYRQHMVSGALISAIAWMLITIRYGVVKSSKAWSIFGALVLGELVVLAPPNSIYAFAFLIVYLLMSLVKKQWGQVRLIASWILIGGAFLFMVLVINYVTTGLFEGTPFRFCLSFWDQARFSKWVSPYMIFYVSELSGPDVGRLLALGEIALSGRIIPLVITALRFEYVSGFFGKLIISPVLFILTIIAVMRGAKVSQYIKTIYLPSFVIFSLVVLSLFTINQTVSLLRTVAFSGFFMIICAFALWHFALRILGRKTLAFFIVCVIVISTIKIVAPASALASRIDFVSGRKSLVEAMEADGANCRPIVEMRREIGSDKIVAFFQINGNLGQAYLFGRGLLNPVSYAYSNKWHILAFEGPEKAIATFKELGIDYFLIDLSAESYDLIAYNSLFETDNMKRYLKLRWSQDPYYLFTWHDKNAISSIIPEDFLDRWLNKKNNPKHFGAGAYKRLKYIYEYNKGGVVNVKMPPDLGPGNCFGDDGYIYKRK